MCRGVGESFKPALKKAGGEYVFTFYQKNLLGDFKLNTVVKNTEPETSVTCDGRSNSPGDGKEEKN